MVTRTFRIAIVPLLAVSLMPLACKGSQRSDSSATKPVGFRILRWSYQADDGSHKPLTVGLWYPAQTAPDPTTTYANRVVGHAAKDAPFAKAEAPYPLIVWSHGYTGSGLGSAHLAEDLAASGNLVAAPDHNDPGTSLRLTGIEGRRGREAATRRVQAVQDLISERPGLNHAKYAYRPKEMSLTIDHLLAENARSDSALHETIDPARIAAGGHSMGGYTVMALTGCLPGRRDERIKAAVLHSPAAWMWRREDYQRMAVPVMLMIGELETIKLLNITEAQTALPAPAWTMVVRGARHGTFGDPRRGPRIRDVGDDPAGPVVSPTILRYTKALFDWTLSLDADTQAAAEAILAAGDEHLLSFVRRAGSASD